MKTKKSRLLLVLVSIVVVVYFMLKRMKKYNVVEVVKKFEGSVKDNSGNHIAYLDSVGVWTIGYGSTRMDGRAVRQGDKISEAKAEKLLLDWLEKDKQSIVKNLGYTPGHNQLVALQSLSYNIGLAGLVNSTLFKYAKQRNHAAAADGMLKWVYGTISGVKRVLPGLVNRRQREREIYLS